MNFCRIPANAEACRAVGEGEERNRANQLGLTNSEAINGCVVNQNKIFQCLLGNLSKHMEWIFFFSFRKVWFDESLVICEYYILAVQTSSRIKRNQRDLQMVRSSCLCKTVVLRTSYRHLSALQWMSWSLLPSRLVVCEGKIQEILFVCSCNEDLIST